MSLTTTDKIFLCIGLIDFGGLLVWIGTALYMACTKADEMLRYLKNCTGIMAISPLRHGGPWGKLMFIGGISGFISFAGFYLKRGKAVAGAECNTVIELKLGHHAA